VTRTVLTVDALVVGAGPAGLAAAVELRSGGAGHVLVLDREDEAGGIPRHCAHTGFGLRDLHRVLSGPAYARRWVARAVAAGVDIRTSSMVTGWSATGRAEVTGPGGLLEVEARAVVLATGARERPRAARLIPGTRPPGVFTTGQLQQWVHQAHLPVGTRALILGAEHVSYSAVLTLREAGVHPVALVTDLPATQTYRAFDVVTRAGLRVPVWTQTSVAGIYGTGRVEQVLLRGPDGAERAVAVDTVVCSGDFVADNELARQAGLLIDPGTGGPACDADGCTSRVGVFAAGNVVHPAETADVAAERARTVGRRAAHWLRSAGEATVPVPDQARVRVADPLRWVVPNLTGTALGKDQPMLLRSQIFLQRPHVEVTQGGRRVASYRPRRLVPNRSQALPAEWQRHLDPDEDVWISVSPPAEAGLTSGRGSSPSARRTRPRSGSPDPSTGPVP
jgi:thioredoxin reductase